MSGVIGVALAICIPAMLSTGLVTGRVRQWALSRAVIDRPNERSLHAVPTPRGGGLAIVIVVGLIEASLLATVEVDPRWGWSSWLATLCLALIGLCDDLWSLSARFRLCLQIGVCGAWGVAVNGFGTTGAGLAWAFQAVAMVWIVNVYNFMDGSDGLAATQAVLAGLFGGLLLGAAGAPQLAVPALLVAASSLGFLHWNWHPARIFLGDVGSYFLGGQFAVLCMASAPGGTSAWVWMILLGPFFVDATLTLCRRIVRREKWFAAHRTHAYQLLAQAGWSHRKLVHALAGLVITLCLPLAAIALARPAWGVACVLLAYAFLATIWLRVVRAHLKPSG